jgi:CO/xanthine dehydrogenase FAD-binding subunit
VPLVAAYHRPTDLAEALDLLADPRRVPLAGGTVLNADRVRSDLEAVDLQDLDLADASLEDRPEGRLLRAGAMARLEQLRRLVPDDLLGEASRRELPSTLRTLATIGGTIAVAESDSVMLAALLVSDCHVRGADGSERPLPQVLSDRSPGLITTVSCTVAGRTCLHATGRTPMDTPIVAAVGRRIGDRTLIALTGVAPTPILVDPADPTRGIDPPTDFRGSAEYRTRLATVLTARAMEDLA